MGAIKATTISEQIYILKKRGLIINNIKFTSDVLLKSNYYNVINELIIKR